MGEATKTGEPEHKPDYSAFVGTRPVTERQRFDSDTLGAWLAQHVDGFAGPLTIEQFAGGQSNPTFKLITPVAHLRDACEARTHGETAAVRTRNRARVPRHACARRHRRAGRAHAALCEDESVIGRAFYVMEFVEGRVLWDQSLPGMTAAERGAIFDEMNRVIAALHSVDYGRDRPRRLRQAGQLLRAPDRRWSKQYRASETETIEAMDNLIEWLPQNIPVRRRERLDRPRRLPPRQPDLPSAPSRSVLAVLDWELSTLGHPLADFAYHCMSLACRPGAVPRHRRHSISSRARHPRRSSSTSQRYCAAHRPRRFIGDWNFYLAYNMFRIAGILQGIMKRVVDGTAASAQCRSTPAGAHSPWPKWLGRGRAYRWQKVQLTDTRRASDEVLHEFSRLHRERIQATRDEKAAARVRRSWTSTSTRTRRAFATRSRTTARTVTPGSRSELIEDLKPKARDAGLWNLFLPESERGAGLTNLEYAPLCEIMGRVGLGRRRCSIAPRPTRATWKPSSATAPRRRRDNGCEPLLEGTIRSAFLMTEPEVASSDATNIETRIKRDGDDYVINGHKWWSSGAGDPRCKLYIVMGKTDPDIPRTQQQSMILVPAHAPGVKVLRHLPVFGYDDAPHGHMEITLEDVRVPASNILLGEGRGFEIAQGRLGPGRIHHCMRLIGVAERALEKMCRRVACSAWPSASRSPIRASPSSASPNARMHDRAGAAAGAASAAYMMDTVGNKAARADIAMIKVVAPNMACQVIDWAMQAHGGGRSDEISAGPCLRHARTLRFADGPDEVHRNAIAKLELARYMDAGAAARKETPITRS